MKPYVICHMIASIDGRTLIDRWCPEDAERRHFFEPLHDRLGVDSWLIGRVSGQGYAKRDAYPNHTDQHYPIASQFCQQFSRLITVTPSVIHNQTQASLQ